MVHFHPIEFEKDPGEYSDVELAGLSAELILEEIAIEHIFGLFAEIAAEVSRHPPLSIDGLAKKMSESRELMVKGWPVGIVYNSSRFEKELEYRVLEQLPRLYWAAYRTIPDSRFPALLQYVYERLNQLHETPSSHLNLAKVYQMQGKPEEALQEAKVGVEQTPNDPMARITLAEIYAQQHKKTDAQRELNAASNLDPNSQHIAVIHQVRTEYNL